MANTLPFPHDIVRKYGLTSGALHALIHRPCDAGRDRPRYKLRVNTVALIDFLQQELDWLPREFSLPSLKLTASDRLEMITSSDSFNPFPSLSSKLPSWLLDVLDLYKNATSLLTRVSPSLDTCGLGMIDIWLAHDILQAKRPSFARRSTYWGRGHLFGGIYRSMYIIIRESGGKVRLDDGAVDLARFQNVSPNLDTDGSFQCGLVSLREINPYLSSLVRLLVSKRVIDLDISHKTDRLTRDQLLELASLPAWLQYMLTLWYNRIRERGQPVSAIPHLAPLENLHPSTIEIAKKAGFTADIAELYVGNKRRMLIPDAVSTDFARCRQNPLFAKYYSVYKGLLK